MEQKERDYSEGTVVLVREKYNNKPVGLFLYQYSINDNENSDRLASMQRKKSFCCIDPKTNKDTVFCGQNYFITDALGVIKRLENQIESALDSLM